MTSTMNSLKVPDSGLRLMASGGDGLPVPTQAFFLTLEDNAIENMIKAVQAGQDMTLKLGNEPTLKYGSNTHIVTPPSDSLPYDLYLTRPFESTKSADRLPCTGSLFRKPKASDSSIKSRPVKEAEKKGSDRSKGSSSSGLESDYETLRDGLAAEEAARGRTNIVDKALAGKRGTLTGRSFSPASLPPSPALRGVGSPSGTAPSAYQQAMERSKYYREPLVHELAVEDRTTDFLREKWDGNESEMLPALGKIADQSPDGKTWTMRKNYFKELNVYHYAYDTTDDREKAIKNAIKIYDKMRLSSREPEWERLNAPEDRGKGICLSNLQAKIAKEPAPPAPPAPKIKVQKADEGSSKEDGNLTDNGKTSRGGEPMSRSSSNPVATKAKKPSAAESQAKRLLSNSKPKPAATAVSASNSLKVSPTKGKGGKAGDGRILSQEIIEDSDVSDDEAPAPKPKAATAKPKIKNPEPVKPRPAARETAKPAPAKRQREDEDSSSSSGTPLAKRIKGRTGALPLKSKSSQQALQRPAATVPPPRKDTSPTKSSPLASSPPTNVSDMDDATPPPQPIKKRQLEMDKAKVMKQRKKARFTEEVMALTSKFKTQYAKYVRLHREIEALPHPSQGEIEHLTTMRNRLAAMKQKITDMSEQAV